MKQKKITFQKSYIDKLQAYAELCSCSLKIAIYWQKIGVWTLNDPSDFNNESSKYSVSIDVAIAKNYIASLGDEMIGTKPSLSIRLICDPLKTSSLDKDGQCQVCFSEIQHYCDNNLITSEVEKRIAFQLLLYSQWEEEEHIEIQDNKVCWIEYSYTPEHYDSSQGFAFIGQLSGIISSKYKRATADKDGVHSISPKGDPDDFEVFIPENYKGQNLPLWRFVLQPNSEYQSP